MILVARPVTVFLCMAPFRKFSLKARLYVSWVGLRGAVPIIFATYPVLADIVEADLLFNVVFLVTLISLAVQGTTVSSMANLLGLAYEEKESAFDVNIHDDIKSVLTEVEVNEAMLRGGETLKEIALPDNTLVMMVCRDGDYFVPQGKTRLELGDKLLVISDRNEELQSTYKDMGILALPPLHLRRTDRERRSRMFPAGKSPAGNLRFVELPPFFGYSFLLCAFPFVHSLFAHSLLPERILFGRSQHVRPIRSGSVLSVLRAVPGSFFGGGCVRLWEQVLRAVFRGRLWAVL